MSLHTYIMTLQDQKWYVVRNVQLHGHSGYGYVPSFLLFMNTYMRTVVRGAAQSNEARQ